MPKRIQRRRIKGWKMPRGTVSVTRPGKFGNPYRGEYAVPLFRAMARRRWTQLERLMRRAYPTANEMTVVVAVCAARMHEKRIREGLPSLRGKDLACFCKPGEACHADILLELANAPMEVHKAEELRAALAQPTQGDAT